MNSQSNKKIIMSLEDYSIGKTPPGLLDHYLKKRKLIQFLNK